MNIRYKGFRLRLPCWFIRGAYSCMKCFGPSKYHLEILEPGLFHANAVSNFHGSNTRGLIRFRETPLNPSSKLWPPNRAQPQAQEPKPWPKMKSNPQPKTILSPWTLNLIFVKPYIRDRRASKFMWGFHKWNSYVSLIHPPKKILRLFESASFCGEAEAKAAEEARIFP